MMKIELKFFFEDFCVFKQIQFSSGKVPSFEVTIGYVSRGRDFYCVK